MKRKRETKEKEKGKEEPIATNSTQEDSDSDEGLFKYPGTISRAQSLKMIQQLEELSESSSEEDARDVIAKRLKTLGKSKKKILSTLSKRSNDKSQTPVNKPQELDDDDDDNLGFVPVTQPKVIDIVNSNEGIKKTVELLRKSEQVVKSYRTTSNIQIDEISNTDNDDVVIDELKTKESQKTKPHHDEDVLPTNTNSINTNATSSSSIDHQNYESKDNDFVLLKARLDEDFIKFKLRRTDPLQKLLDSFCERKKLEKAKTRLLFDGLTIDLDKTPEDLGMDDGDIIDSKVI